MTTQVPDTVTSMLMRALSDPGSITERKTLHVDWDGSPAYESLTAWQARAVLEILPPLIARAEREKLATVMSPGQFRKLASWFDADDEFKVAMFPETWSPGSRPDEVQQDLRRFADLLESP